MILSQTNFRRNFLERVWKVIMTNDDDIRDGKL